MANERDTSRSGKPSLVEPMDEREEAMLRARLGRYTVEEPTTRETASFAAKLVDEWEARSSTDSSRAAAPVSVAAAMLRSHSRLFPWTYTLLAGLMLLLGFAIELLVGDGNAVRPFLFTPALLAAISICYGFRSYGTPMFELELSLPVNPFLLIFSRLALIVGYYTLLGMLLTTIWRGLQPDIVAYIASWLLPLGLFSLAAIVFLLYFGVFAGLLATVLLWMVQLLLNEQLKLLFWFGERSSPYGLSGKIVCLVLMAPLAVLLIRRVRRLTARIPGGLS